ncbi:unnamed protein product [Discosporangium mesarthrocarpum]
MFIQFLRCILYGLCSTMVIFVNKVVMTTMRFPSFGFIAISQFVTTCVIINSGRLAGLVEISTKTVSPLTVLFRFNTLSGLGGTKHVNLPMFTVLRQFSILMTTMMEKWLLKITLTSVVGLGVLLMIGGAVVAAGRDLNFDLEGYTYMLLNDVFTAAYGIDLKRALNPNIPQVR